MFWFPIVVFRPDVKREIAEWCFDRNLHQSTETFDCKLSFVFSESLSGITMWSMKESYASGVRSTVSAPFLSLTFRFMASSRLSQRAGTTFVTKFSK